MRVDLRHHVAAHRHAIRLGQRGHLPPWRDAAHAGQVEDEHVDRARLQQRPEPVQVIDVLAGRDRHP